MTHFLVLLLALLIGVVAGLRSLTAPAVVAWAAMLDWINLDGTWAEWVGHPITVAVLTVLAVGELITDKLPKTPSRKSPMGFGARLVIGALRRCGHRNGVGLYLRRTRRRPDRRRARHARRSYEARRRLVAANGGHDLPIALVEDAVAVLGGLAVAALTAVV